MSLWSLDKYGAIGPTLEGVLVTMRMPMTSFTACDFVVIDQRQQGRTVIMTAHNEREFATDLNLLSTGAGVNLLCG
jgi:hypothetical protein